MLNKIIQWGLTILVFLLPLFFLPVTTDFYDFNKNVLLLVAGGLLLLLWGLKMVAEKRLVFQKTAFDLPVLLIAAAYLLSTVFAAPNKIEAVMMPGGVATIFGLTLLYFLITNNPADLRSDLVAALIAAAGLLSLIAIYQFIGLGEALVPAQAGLDWLRVKTWTPAAGLLSLASFLLVALTLNLTRIYADWKKEGYKTSLYLYLPAAFLLFIGLAVTAYQLLTSAKPVLLPQTAGWAIAIEAFKNSPFWGVGLDNFIFAFTNAKPLGLNAGPLWNLRFTASSNFYFHLLTTVGIFGLAGFLFLIWKVIKAGANQYELSAGLLVIFILLAFLPANFLLLAAGYLLLGLLAAGLQPVEVHEDSRLLSQAAFVFLLLIVGSTFYAVGRAYAAEYYFKQSLEASLQNKGTETYNLQIKTIQTNPYKSLYHLAYSQTNLALANSLAAKKDLTDQDRQNISQLIQQAIGEAKNAIALSPKNVTGWENLAVIYRQIINLAQGADQWTIAAYNQAISLDPANPLLRLDLGGVFYAGKNYDEALRQFSLAGNLKPDLANIHYNLAAAFREKGLIKEAVYEMEQTQALVEPGSNDFKKAAQELEDLRAKLPKEEKQASSSALPETLTQPTGPSTSLKPPLTLPKEAQPEISTPSGR